MSEVNADTEDAEVVDGLPVLAGDATEVVGTEPAPLPVRHAAAVAVGGFAAGAATVALVSRRRTRKVVGRRGRKGKRGVIGEVIGSNSFLVDVHLLRRD